MNKRAQTGDMMSILYFILLLVIIGGTIFLMANVVMGKNYDSRLTDASLLAYKMENCIDGNSFSAKDIENIEGTCGIKLNEKRYVLHVYINDKVIYRYGDAVSCGLYSIGEQNSRCVQSTARAIVDGKQAEIRIIAGSNNWEENDE